MCMQLHAFQGYQVFLLSDFGTVPTVSFVFSFCFVFAPPPLFPPHFILRKLYFAGLYHILIEPMHLSKSTKKIIFASMTLGIACGYAISRRLRCVCCLLIPTFFGKTGRSYVGTFAIGYLIAGTGI